MLFNSLEFAVFLPIVVAMYFLVAPSWRIRVLLVASCIFYMAFIPEYIAILFVTIIIDYVAGIYLEKTEGARRKSILLVSIVSTCSVLVVFKYFNFFSESLAAALSFLGVPASPLVAKIILPIGLSFHTFQSLSYVIEVYRGHQKAIHSFEHYATYVMFFPQLVAGPIERPQNLLPQFVEGHKFAYEDVTAGLKRMAWGFFKKLVIADRLAIYVNDVYADPHSFNGLQLTLATLFFAYQIYCDFSGYSDIAIGSARILGFRLMENFHTPYFSRSVSEFWRRWHISLSSWFKDYFYVPLGGSRVAAGRQVFNLIATFALSGLWHGANWTFVLWGLLNGVYLVAGKFSRPWRDRLSAAVGIAENSLFRRATMLSCTFALTCVAWVLFRAESLHDAVYIYSHLLVGWDFNQIATPHFLLRQLPVAFLSIAVLEMCQMFGNRVDVPTFALRFPQPARWAFYTAGVLMVILFGVYQKTQFIYFQF